ncbi:hypothetical protein STIUS_v1c06530 [Spiroplasma sp. TIUS-1]|uniref:hypothetical protein n=1 Tax=Spiroplasma sp. TIUS-1 TaxID=216963 RepID=UPI0013973BEA|nr:hypothetical protein [Spiroplasma sp. TIUS-1]QHX36207.1 hypothetical protein STIUS_v1c06530 [Spiroplasma sp. TIUS-1]
MKSLFQKNSINTQAIKVFNKTVFYSVAIIIALFVTNLIFIGIVYSSKTLQIYMDHNDIFVESFGKNVNISPMEIDVSIWLGFTMLIVGLTIFLLVPFTLTKSKKLLKYTFPTLMFTLILVVGSLISFTAGETSYDKLTKLINYITAEGVLEEIKSNSKNLELNNAVQALFDEHDNSFHLAWSAKSLAWTISIIKIVVVSVVYTKTFYDHATLSNENSNITEKMNIKTKKGYIGKNKLYNVFTKITVLNQKNICLWVFILILVISMPQIIYIGSVLNTKSSLGSMFAWNLYLSDLLSWNVDDSDIWAIINVISDDKINNLNVISVQAAMVMGVISMLLVMPIYFIRNWNVEDKVIATQSFSLILLSALLVMVNFYSMELLSKASVTWNNNHEMIKNLMEYKYPDLDSSLAHIKELCGTSNVASDGTFNFRWPIGVELISLLVLSLLALIVITIVLIHVFYSHKILIRANTSTHYFEDEEWY